jgi:SAM-dependent methyltransferase
MTMAKGFQNGGASQDLFLGTASFYARYRPEYPVQLIGAIAKDHHLDGRGRLLDCGCGTGQVFLGLAPYFEEVVAFDPDPEMIAEAKSSADSRNLSRVRLLNMRAEDVSADLGEFRLAAFGASFHWTDRERVAELAYDRLQVGGGLVLICGGGIWNGKQAWEKAAVATIKKWLGPERRAGSGVFQQGPLHQEVLKKSRFQEIKSTDVIAEYDWTVDDILGYLYSTSFSSKRVLGERAAGFENDLRQALMPLSKKGIFRERIEYSIISAKKTSSPRRNPRG